MITLTTVQECMDFRKDSRTKTVGFVPTMGALHEGHAALMRRARAENALTAISIFVNPTQFDNPDDYAKYPITLEGDLKIAEREGVDIVYLPQAKEIYHDDFRYRMTEHRYSKVLEGAHRTGHFDGVLTVVLKLLNLLQPTKAYFGEKDYQQLELVRGMCEAFFLTTEIVACETVRDSDGLAMSSRNRRLSEAGRLLAPEFAQLLKTNLNDAEISARLKSQGFDVDYVETQGSRRLGAVRIENIRLIDNVEI